MSPTPCDVAWGHLTLASLPLRPLAVDSSATEWATAFNTRGNLASLLLLPPYTSPFRFGRTGTAEEAEERAGLARKVLEQNEEQKGRLGRHGLPRGKAEAESILRTFVEGPDKRRWLCILSGKEQGAGAEHWQGRVLISHFPRICSLWPRIISIELFESTCKRPLRRWWVPLFARVWRNFTFPSNAELIHFALLLRNTVPLRSETRARQLDDLPRRRALGRVQCPAEGRRSRSRETLS